MLSYVWSRGAALKVWLDRLVLLVELGQVGHDILDDVGMGKWVDLRFLLGIGWNTAYYEVSFRSTSTFTTICLWD